MNLARRSRTKARSLCAVTLEPDAIRPRRPRPRRVAYGKWESDGFDHVRMAQQGLLDVAGRDLLTSPVDDVFDPPNNEEISVAIQVSEVAGSKPAIPKCGFVGCGIVIVSPGDGRAPQRDLSPFAGWQPSAPFVHDRDLGTRGLADRTRLASFQRVRGDLGSGFRHAVGIDHRDTKQRFQSADHVGRQRRRGRADEPQRVLLDVVFETTLPRTTTPDGLSEPPCTRSAESPSANRRRRRDRIRGCKPHLIRQPTQPAAPRTGHVHGTGAGHSAIGPAIQVPMSRPRYGPTDRRPPASVGPSSAATSARGQQDKGVVGAVGC